MKKKSIPLIAFTMTLTLLSAYFFYDALTSEHRSGWIFSAIMFAFNCVGLRRAAQGEPVFKRVGSCRANGEAR